MNENNRKILESLNCSVLERVGDRTIENLIIYGLEGLEDKDD